MLLRGTKRTRLHDPTHRLGNTMQTFVKTDSPEILPSCHTPSPADEWEDEPGEGLDDGGVGGSIDLRTLRWMQMQMQMQMEQQLMQYRTHLGAWRMRQAERAGEAADGAEISQLETKTLSACTKCDGVCAVCQCEWEEHDEVRVLPCGHQFHTCCVDRWLSKHKACCPLCKADVRPSWDDVSTQEEWDPVAAAWRPGVEDQGVEEGVEEGVHDAAVRARRGQPRLVPTRRPRRQPQPTERREKGLRLKNFRLLKRSTSAARR
jgi:hypothetical protein